MNSGHAELRALVPRLVTRHHAHHYLGFADTQWRLFEKERPRRVKPLLYVFRVLLTGIHLMRTSEVEATLVRLNESFGLPYIGELVARKLAGPEQSTLDERDIALYAAEYARLRGELEAAREASRLPDEPSCRRARRTAPGWPSSSHHTSADDYQVGSVGGVAPRMCQPTSRPSCMLSLSRTLYNREPRRWPSPTLRPRTQRHFSSPACTTAAANATSTRPATSIAPHSPMSGPPTTRPGGPYPGTIWGWLAELEQASTSEVLERALAAAVDEPDYLEVDVASRAVAADAAAWVASQTETNVEQLVALARRAIVSCPARLGADRPMGGE